MEIRARLVVERGMDKGRIFDVGKDGARLGRSSQNDVAINDEKLSRHHCRIYFSPDGIPHLSDLGSANETLLNDVPIHEERLKSGDLITIGDTVLRVIEDASGAETRASADAAEESSKQTHPDGTQTPVVPHIRPKRQTSTTTMAFAGFLAGMSIIAFPVAIVLGVLSHRTISRDGGTTKARTMANFAIGLGVLWLLVTLLATSVLVW